MHVYVGVHVDVDGDTIVAVACLSRRPELKRQYSTPTMGGLRPTKKTPSTLSPGQARLSTSRPTSPRMSNIRGASPKPHRGSLQLKFESVESRGRDGEFENVQMR
jgi:hypothetical protein